MLESSLESIMILKAEHVELVNRACENLLQAPCSELVGRRFLDFVDPGDRPAVEQRLTLLRAPGQRLPLYELKVLRSDGLPIEVEASDLRIVLSDNEPCILTVLRDITDRKRLDRESHLSETRFRTILDTAMDGIITINAGHEIVMMNAAAEAIFGYPSGSLIGTSLDVLIPNRFRPRHGDLIAEFGRGAVANRRMSSQRAVSALRSDGSEFPIEASISHSEVKGEKLYTVILRDVSEAQRQRELIRQQAQILDQLPDAVSVHDLAGHVTFWNPGAEALFKINANNMLAKDVEASIYQMHPKQQAQIQIALETQGRWVGEFEIAGAANGDVLTVEHHRVMLRDQAGTPTGVFCIDIDISERKKREQLERRSQRLESIGTLAGGIAHDLNNVLTPILMGAKLLALDRPANERAGLLSTIIASTERGAELVKQLLSFAGGIQGERAPVQIQQVVNETQGILRHTLPKSIRIEAHVAPDCLPVNGDATELSQVLMNLCINARDAMTEGGCLQISAENTVLTGNPKTIHPDAHQGPYVVLRVDDTGVGMTPQVLDKIFDPFFTTKGFGKGIGLGLAMSQGIVKSHGGFINVYTEPGKGSRFAVYLPANAPHPLQSARGATEAPRAGQGETILLVDDEPLILAMAGTALSNAGYRVLTANGGVEAMAAFARAENRIQLVILDMMMPDMDGLQTMSALRAISPEIRIIACSGLRTAQREAEVLRLGATAFLPKPYSDQQLLKALGDVLLK